jgi:DNA-binding transcriptional LysR family regulator
MELRQMRYFLAVVDHGGITRAATQLYISQPSLSQAIRTLEAQFGTALFERVGRELVPTEAGLTLAESLRGVLSLVDDATRRVRDVVQLEAGRLTIATASTLGIHPTAEWVRAYLDRHPQMLVHVDDVGSTSHAVSALRSGAADLALVELPTGESTIVTHPWREEELLLAGSVPELDRFDDSVPADAVGEIPFGIMSREEGGYSASQRMIASLLRDIRATCSDRQLLWELVLGGAVATFIPRRAATIMLPGVPLRHVDPPVMRTVGIAHREGYLPPASEAFLGVALSSTSWRANATSASAMSESAVGS